MVTTRKNPIPKKRPRLSGRKNKSISMPNGLPIVVGNHLARARGKSLPPLPCIKFENILKSVSNCVEKEDGQEVRVMARAVVCHHLWRQERWRRKILYGCVCWYWGICGQEGFQVGHWRGLFSPRPMQSFVQAN